MDISKLYCQIGGVHGNEQPAARQPSTISTSPTFVNGAKCDSVKTNKDSWGAELAEPPHESLFVSSGAYWLALVNAISVKTAVSPSHQNSGRKLRWSFSCVAPL
jgi:hypothetical protein